MAKTDLTVTIEAGTSSIVLLPNVISQLDCLFDTVRALESELDASMELVSLSMNSPLRAVLRPVVSKQVDTKGSKKTDSSPAGKLKKDEKFKSAPTVGRRAVRSIQAYSDKSVKNFDPVVAHRLSEFGKSLDKGDSVATIESGGATVVVKASIIEAIDSLIGKPLFAETTCYGQVDLVSIRGSAPSFGLKNLNTGHRTNCLFTMDQVEEIRGLLGQMVEVSGVAEWVQKSPDPVRIRVKSVRSVEIKNPLPLSEWVNQRRRAWNEMTEEERLSIQELREAEWQS